MNDVLPSTPRRSEPAIAAVTAVYAVLLAPAAGLVWGSVAPKLSIAALAANSDGTFHAQIGADAWFLLVGGVAGALTAVLALIVLRSDGPGLAVGLAVGGGLAAVVADRVGYLSQRHETTSALRALGAHVDGSLLSEIDFRVRALGVLTVWPLAALVVLGIVVAVNSARR